MRTSNQPRNHRRACPSPYDEPQHLDQPGPGYTATTPHVPVPRPQPLRSDFERPTSVPSWLSEDFALPRRSPPMDELPHGTTANPNLLHILGGMQGAAPRSNTPAGDSSSHSRLHVRNKELKRTSSYGPVHTHTHTHTHTHPQASDEALPGAPRARRIHPSERPRPRAPIIPTHRAPATDPIITRGGVGHERTKRNSRSQRRGRTLEQQEEEELRHEDGWSTAPLGNDDGDSVHMLNIDSVTATHDSEDDDHIDVEEDSTLSDEPHTPGPPHQLHRRISDDSHSTSQLHPQHPQQQRGREDDFAIPELPRGSVLTIHIFSTWGDPYFVGLNGIEVFNGSGHSIGKIGAGVKHIWSSSPHAHSGTVDTHDHPNTFGMRNGHTGDHDESSIRNLLDECNHTTDAHHTWIAPFTQGSSHVIGIEFEGPVALSMIRVWNYNRSRIHSYRGVRYVEMSLDNHIIFQGEIKKARTLIRQQTHAPLYHTHMDAFSQPTWEYEEEDLSGVDACSECILFTTSQTILKVIERYDKYVQEASTDQTSPKDDNGTNDPRTRVHLDADARLQRGGDSTWTPLSSVEGNLRNHEHACIADMIELDRPSTACGRIKTPTETVGASNRGMAERSHEHAVQWLDTPSGVAGGGLGGAHSVYDGASEGSDESEGDCDSVHTYTHAHDVAAETLSQGGLLSEEWRAHGAGTPPVASGSMVQGRVIDVHILTNWGDPLAVGFDCIQVLDAALQPVDMAGATASVCEVSRVAPAHPTEALRYGVNAIAQATGLVSRTRVAGVSSNTHTRASDNKVLVYIPLDESEDSALQHSLGLPTESEPVGSHGGPFVFGWNRRFDHEVRIDPPGEMQDLHGGCVYGDVPHMDVVAQYDYDHPLVVRIDLGREVDIGAIKVWNLNESFESTFVGVKHTLIHVDGHVVCPTLAPTANLGGNRSRGFASPQAQKRQAAEANGYVCLVRKAPGSANFDHGQLIQLRRIHTHEARPSTAVHRRVIESHRASPTMLPQRHRSRGGDSTGDTHDEGDPEAVAGFINLCLNDDSSDSNSCIDDDERLLLESVNSLAFDPSQSMCLCAVNQQYETPLLPTGCIFKFVLLSSWGDRFYVGLNGLEVFTVDSGSEPLRLAERQVKAMPQDLNVLPEFSQPQSKSGKDRYGGTGGQAAGGAPRKPDTRTLDKVYDGVNCTYDDAHMWLCPLTPLSGGIKQSGALPTLYEHQAAFPPGSKAQTRTNQLHGPNKVFLVFDEPVTLSHICLWNYSKTPTRGVQDFELYVDDVLVYRGALRKAPTRAENAGVDGGVLRDFKQTILFTNDPEVTKAEAEFVYSSEDLAEDMSIVFIDEGISRSENGGADEGLVRPFTAVSAPRR